MSHLKPTSNANLIAIFHVIFTFDPLTFTCLFVHPLLELKRHRHPHLPSAPALPDRLNPRSALVLHYMWNIFILRLGLSETMPHPRLHSSYPCCICVYQFAPPLVGRDATAEVRSSNGSNGLQARIALNSVSLNSWESSDSFRNTTSSRFTHARHINRQSVIKLGDQTLHMGSTAHVIDTW
jgi:hypothetical protein